MMRSLVSLRTALPSDASVLAELWADVLRRADHAERIADLVKVIEAAAESPATGWSSPSTTARSRAPYTCGARR